MKILWLSRTPSLYKKQNKGYNGCGWIESLELLIRNQKDVQLAVSFIHTDTCFKVELSDVTYYPISVNSNIKKKIKRLFFPSVADQNEILAFLKVIDDFKPDIINVFGTEQSLGLIAKYTMIPVIIHIQGFLNPCVNAFFPPGYGFINFLFSTRFNFYKLTKKFLSYKIFKRSAKRELEILRSCHNYLGRTAWDEHITMLLSPKCHYYFCNEILRYPFYHSPQWKFKQREIIKISTTISDPLFKGFDLILKTAYLLTKYSTVQFEWHVFGIAETKSIERFLGINANSVKVINEGIVSSVLLIEKLLDSDLYIHPSYIENSSNSICEAQILGVPVISTNVGGLESLIDNWQTGVIIPANDPFYLASLIHNYPEKKEKYIQMGENARHVALDRHDPDIILAKLLNIYKDLMCN